MNDKVLSCQSKPKGRISFKLVDEYGNGKPYGNLAYIVTDIEGKEHKGVLDANGYAEITNLKGSGVILRFDEKYNGQEDWYKHLLKRKRYSLPITQFQYIAEQTRHRQENEKMAVRDDFDVCAQSTFHWAFEVSDFVEYTSHLPPRLGQIEATAVDKANYVRILAGDKAPAYGVGLSIDQDHVLMVKALRAFRPLVSLEKEFSTLNMFQLAIMAALSYRDFEGKGAFQTSPWYSANNPNKKGFLFGDVGSILSAWSLYRKPEQFGKANSSGGDNLKLKNELWVPLVEDVPYSKRLEVVPFDPTLYPNLNEVDTKDPTKENPATVHFFERKGNYFKGEDDVQGFATHDDRMVLLVARGTQEVADFLTDARAQQVKLAEDEGEGKAHKGFYNSFKLIKAFYERYLDNFFIKEAHKIVVVGHSLGGAIATLVAEWVRRKYGDNVILYTYGSPRVGTESFVKGAEALTHYRMVSHYDPIPTVPWPSMSTHWPTLISGIGLAISNPIVGIGVFLVGLKHLGGEDYWHHGELHHFITLDMGSNHPNVADMTEACFPEKASVSQLPKNDSFVQCPLYDTTSIVMWKPSAVGIKNNVVGEAYLQAKAITSKNGLPFNENSVIKTLLNLGYMSNHFMFTSYIPASWSVFKRWTDASKAGGTQITAQEYNYLEKGVNNYKYELHDNLTHSPKKLSVESQVEIKTELSNTDITLARINTLHNEVITQAMAYGSDVITLTDFNTIVTQWQKDDQARINAIKERVVKYKSSR